MKLSEWAREKGICYKTALNWFKKGIMPVKCTQLSTGTILVEDNKSNDLIELKNNKNKRIFKGNANITILIEKN